VCVCVCVCADMNAKDKEDRIERALRKKVITIGLFVRRLVP